MNITEESKNVMTDEQLEKYCKKYGKFHPKSKKTRALVELFDNISLRDKKFMQIIRDNNVNLQLDLFTPID